MCVIFYVKTGVHRLLARVGMLVRWIGVSMDRIRIYRGRAWGIVFD